LVAVILRKYKTKSKTNHNAKILNTVAMTIRKLQAFNCYGSLAVKQVTHGAMSSAVSLLRLRHSNTVGLLGVCTQSHGPILFFNDFSLLP
jgi:hypothetical protein